MFQYGMHVCGTLNAIPSYVTYVGGEKASIFGTYGGLGALYVRLCVFWTFDTHSHKFQHKNKLHTSFHDDPVIKSIFGDFLITGYEL